jgi:hypothetical protein
MYAEGNIDGIPTKEFNNDLKDGIKNIKDTNLT